MKSESEAFDAIRTFVKLVGTPKANICDSAKAQKSKEVKELLTSIGKSLRLLEVRTPWANKAELYVGLMQSAMYKYTKKASCISTFLGIFYRTVG